MPHVLPELRYFISMQNDVYQRHLEKDLLHQTKDISRNVFTPIWKKFKTLKIVLKWILDTYFRNKVTAVSAVNIWSEARSAKVRPKVCFLIAKNWEWGLRMLWISFPCMSSAEANVKETGASDHFSAESLYSILHFCLESWPRFVPFAIGYHGVSDAATPGRPILSAYPNEENTSFK